LTADEDPDKVEVVEEVLIDDPRRRLMPEEIEFVVNGRSLALSHQAVVDAMKGVTPEPIRSHTVAVDGTRYPVKQVFEEATGLDRLDFTSAVARRQLVKLGFDVGRS
jgi:hypothetical protein